MQTSSSIACHQRHSKQYEPSLARCDCAVSMIQSKGAAKALLALHVFKRIYGIGAGCDGRWRRAMKFDPLGIEAFLHVIPRGQTEMH